MRLAADHDFPEQWQELLPELMKKMNTPDLHMINSLLETANALFLRFRGAHKCDELMLKLKYVLETFQVVMLQIWQAMCQQLATLSASSDAPGLKEQLDAVIEALSLLANMFYSLNWQDLPEFFEDNMDAWFGCE